MIQLGQEIGADTLLMDDRKAVFEARKLGFRVAPTIAIYIEAKRRGLLARVRPKVERLRAVGFRLSESDCQAVLAAAGEV